MDCIESITSIMETEEEQKSPVEASKNTTTATSSSSTNDSDHGDDSFSELVVVETPKDNSTLVATALVPVEQPKETPVQNEESTNDDAHAESSKEPTTTTTTTTTTTNKFCKVQEPPTVAGGTPRFHLIPLADFCTTDITDASVAKLQACIQAKVPAGQRLTQGGYLYHLESNKDVNLKQSLIAITSDQVLASILLQKEQQLTILLPEPGMESYQWPSFDIEIKAAWDDSLHTKFPGHRLFDANETDDTKKIPLFSLLVDMTARQFHQPGVALSFLVTQPEDGVISRKLTNNDDMVDLLTWVDPGSTVTIQVGLVYCPFIKVTYPTVDGSALSRRIPLNNIVKADASGVSYEKLLLAVADTLGSDEFVLTYKDSSDGTKFFITCLNDLLEALARFCDTELALTPQLPGDEEEENEAKEAASSKAPVVEEHSFSEETKPVLLLQYQGRENAKVEFPLDRVLVNWNNAKASFWKLVELAMEAFHIQSPGNGEPPRICIFHILPNGEKAEITSDSYLTQLIKNLSHPETFNYTYADMAQIQIRIEPVIFSLASFRNGFSLRHFSMSHVGYKNGSAVSFLKLVRLARMLDPVTGLAYIGKANGTRIAIDSDTDLMNALYDHPNGDLVIRQKVQANPSVLSVRDASLSGKKSRLGSWSIPNIMFKTEFGLSIWNLSQLVVGRYRFTTQYWRDLNKGPVALSIGVVIAKDADGAASHVKDEDHRKVLLKTISLDATGLNEWEFSKATSLADLDVPSNTNSGAETSFFVIAACMTAPEQSPEVFISNVECTYLGPVPNKDV